MSVQKPRGDPNISRGEAFGLLANPRRRRVLHYLRRSGGTATLSDMASRIAAWENDVSVDGLSAAERKSVYTSLQQNHLGKLDEAGVVEYDQDRGFVRATEAAAELDVYLEVVPGRAFPWREYYLALGAVSTALVIVGWADIGVFALAPDAAYATVVAVTLLLSAAVQVGREWVRGTGTGEGPPVGED